MRNKKVGLARRVRTRLARFPFCDGRVTILAGPSFLRINTLARILDPSAPHGVEIAPSRVNLVTWLRRDNQSMRTCCFTQSRQVQVLLARATEVVNFFFSYRRSLKLTRLGGGPFCPEQVFSI